MSNIPKVMNMWGMMGQMGLDDKTTTLNTNIFYHPSPSFSCVYNFRYIWHMGLELHIQLNESCIYYV